MKKIFTFIAAMLVAFAASATVINITPTSPETSDNLRKALNTAQDGDEIVMAAGTYVESNGNYIAFAGKHVTVKAADGAEVLIQPQVPITISAGGCAHFVGVKFDVSRLNELATWYEHLMYADDATNNSIILDSCELYNFNINKSMLYCNSSNVLASVSINNCYFHNILKSILFVENTGAMNLSVTNSTFANISTNTESYWAGVIDVRASGSTVNVDHCTFYNVIPMNTDYSAVSKVSIANGVVSNCIFMLPTATDKTRAIRGLAHANNCITYNYLYDSGTGIHSSVTKSNCTQVDPLFVDAANGDFTLSEGSPALGTATDGGNLGDSRWWPAVPSAATTVYFAPGVWNQDGAKYAIYAYEPGNTPEFQWSDFLALAENETNIYTGTVPAGYSHLVFVRLNAACATPCWEDKWNQTRNLTIVEGGKNLYTIDAWGDDGKPSPGTWSTYVAPTVLENGYYIAGIINGAGGWSVSDLSADRQLIHSNEVDEEWYKDITLAIGDEFKVVYVENNAINTWYPASPAGNYVIEADHAGDKTVYFRPDGVDHPELNDGWYYGKIYVQPNPIQLNLVAGWNTVCLPYAAEIANVDAYEIQDINYGGGTISLTPMNDVLEPATAYLIYAAAAGDHTATLMGGKVTTPVEVDGFRGNLSETPEILAATDANYGYLVLSGNEFHLLLGDATANVAQYKAYIRLGKATAPSVLRIVNGATNIQNVEGNETAVKFIENGKLFIKKNGVVYDAVGAVVK